MLFVDQSVGSCFYHVTSILCAMCLRSSALRLLPLPSPASTINTYSPQSSKLPAHLAPLGSNENLDKFFIISLFKSDKSSKPGLQWPPMMQTPYSPLIPLLPPYTCTHQLTMTAGHQPP